VHRAWATILQPVLDAVEAKVVLEIGAAQGRGTEQLARWAAEHAAVVHSVDPRFDFPEDEWRERHAPHLELHRDLSVDVVGEIAGVDVALIDGDHNWYTVRSELRLLAAAADREGADGPVCLLHDVGWPYGRRDLYYDPDTVPSEHRQPYARRGLVPKTAELVDDGFNEHLNNALVEGGNANGVLTAVEDFVGERKGWSHLALPGLHGVGLVWPDAVPERKPALAELLEHLNSPAFLSAWAAEIELHRLHAIVELTRQRRRANRLAARAEEAESELRQASEASELSEGDTSRLEAVAARRADEAQRAGRMAEELRENLERARKELKDVRARAAHLNDELSAAEAGRDEIGAQVDDLAGELTIARRALAEREQSLADLEAKVARGEEELAAARVAVDLHMSGELALQRELHSLAEERTALEGTRRRLEDGLRSAERAAATARAEAEVRQEELERLRAELASTREAVLRAASPLPAGEPSEHVAPAMTVPPPGAVEAPEVPEVPEAPEVLEAAEEPGVDRVVRPADAESPDDAVRTWLVGRYRSSLGVDLRDGSSDAAYGRAMPVDRRGVLEPLVRTPAHPTVDVVVCVHNALEDVRLCLWSLLAKGTYPFHLIVVNDGSDAATTEMLAQVAQANPAVTLISNPDPPHGYTIAANLGMKASRGDYVILLNSDTIVTQGWLERLVACAESDGRIGIFGPLSNAASHQSVPALREEGRWATNPLPPWLNPDGMAAVVAGVSRQQHPLVPFVNGFCYGIRRRLLEAIGTFDEENFASGYCEENDFSFRAVEAGWMLAIVDDAYVYHVKSSSYAVEGRNQRAKRNYQIFLEKHDRERIDGLVKELEESTALDDLRATIGESLAGPERALRALHAGGVDPLDVVFILPGLGRGGSGGSHSVYQETQGLRRLGVRARIALAADHMDRAVAAYPDAEEVFVPYKSVKALRALTRDTNVVVATHYKSVALLAELRAQRDDFLPAYYVQDYEPFFSQVDARDVKEAVASYTLMPDALLFAKTHWLCNVVGHAHGVDVAKVSPSIDDGVYRPGDALGDTPVHIAAMVRPRTPRRQACGTISVLERVRERLGDRVRITTFGCEREELSSLTADPATLAGHRGLLRREDVAEVLRTSHVFLDFSAYQAFGRTALEAMACGATAVIPKVGGVHEYARHDVNALLVDTFDEEPATNALLNLAGNPERLARLRGAAVDTASRYSIAGAALSEYVLFLHEHQRRFSRIESSPAAPIDGAGVRSQ
jgi:O-antigen biosynthesis protein